MFRTCASALAESGTDQAVHALAQALAQAPEGAESRTRKQLLLLAIGLAGGDRAVSTLEDVLAAPDTYTGRAARQALGEIGNDRALDILERLVTDGDLDYSLRRAALRSLSRVGGQRALALLDRGMSENPVNPNHSVCSAAALSLAEIGTRPALERLSKGWADRHQRFPGSNAAYQLSDSTFWRVRPLLDQAWEAAANDRLGDEDQRRAVAIAFGVLGTRNAWPALTRALADERVEVRLNAAYILGFMECDQALELLGNSLTDEDSRVRQAVLEALKFFTDRELRIQARDLLLAQYERETRGATRLEIRNQLRQMFPDDPAVQAAFN